MASQIGTIDSWPAADLTISAADRGLLIEQAGARYLAVDWRVTDQVRAFIEAAVSFGFTTLIRSQHPQPNRREKGVRYIGVSRTPHERWVAVLDQYSPATGLRGGTVRRFTVEQAYRTVLGSHGIPYTQERGGGRNLYVEFERHRDVFAAAAAHVEAVESGLGARHWNQVKDEIGFITEAVLETALISRWSTIKAFDDLDLLGNQVDRVDLLARHRGSGALVLMELKRGVAGGEVLAQLDRYVRGSAMGYREREPVWGAVVARDFTPELLDGLAAASFPVALFTFAGSPATLAIDQVASSWPTVE
jgi:hypothetical protein